MLGVVIKNWCPCKCYVDLPVFKAQLLFQYCLAGNAAFVSGCYLNPEMIPSLKTEHMRNYMTFFLQEHE